MRYLPAGHRGEGAWGRLSWAEYLLAARQVAGGLAELGVVPGGRVGILSANRVEWHLADLGTLLNGSVTVPVYPTSSAAQIAYILGHCRGDRLLRGHPRPAGQAHGGARPAAGTQAADPRRGRPAGRGLVRARLRRSARRRHQPPGAAPRSRLRARPQRPARGPRHDRLHEWCLRTPQGGHAHAREHHVDAAQRDPRLRHRRGRTPVVVPAPQPHRRADDERVPADRRRRRDLVRPQSGHGRRGPADVPADGVPRRPRVWEKLRETVERRLQAEALPVRLAVQAYVGLGLRKVASEQAGTPMPRAALELYRSLGR